MRFRLSDGYGTVSAEFKDVAKAKALYDSPVAGFHVQMFDGEIGDWRRWPGTRTQYVEMSLCD